jgi:hypothetical protein
MPGKFDFEQLRICVFNNSSRVLRLGPSLEAREGRMQATQSADLGFSVHLRNGVPQSNHVTSRRFGGATARILGTFCEVHFEQKVALLLYAYYCLWA